MSQLSSSLCSFVISFCCSLAGDSVIKFFVHLSYWGSFIVACSGLLAASIQLCPVLFISPLWKVIMGVFLLCLIWFLVLYCFYIMWDVYQFELHSTPIDKDDEIK